MPARIILTVDLEDYTVPREILASAYQDGAEIAHIASGRIFNRRLSYPDPYHLSKYCSHKLCNHPDKATFFRDVLSPEEKALKAAFINHVSTISALHLGISDWDNLTNDQIGDRAAANDAWRDVSHAYNKKKAKIIRMYPMPVPGVPVTSERAWLPAPASHRLSWLFTTGKIFLSAVVLLVAVVWALRLPYFSDYLVQPVTGDNSATALGHPAETPSLPCTSVSGYTELFVAASSMVLVNIKHGAAWFLAHVVPGSTTKQASNSSPTLATEEAPLKQGSKRAADTSVADPDLLDTPNLTEPQRLNLKKRREWHRQHATFEPSEGGEKGKKNLAWLDALKVKQKTSTCGGLNCESEQQE